MTQDIDTNDRDALRRRPHPLIGKFVQFWRTSNGARLEWTGEAHTVVRTNARYGDALMIDVLSDDRQTVERMQLVSVTDLASVSPDFHFAIFDVINEADAYAASIMPPCAISGMMIAPA